MRSEYNLLMLAISFFVATLATYAVFALCHHIYKAPAKSRNVMLVVYSAITGTGLWLNHLLVAFSTFSKFRPHFSPVMLILGWFFAIGLGYAILYVASQRELKMRQLTNTGLVGIVLVLGMFFADWLSNLGYNEFHIKRPQLAMASVITLFVVVGNTVIFSWAKSYAGAYSKLIKLSLAGMLSLSIFAVHVAYNQAIVANTFMIKLSNGYLDQEMIGFSIALGILSLFSMAFASTLLYERLQNRRILQLSEPGNLNSPNLALDALTQLPNRKAFQTQLEAAAKRCARTGNTMAIAYIDLDHFKPVNDQHGHHVGDILLSKVADRLNTAVRGCDFVSRIGGDEFVAIIEEIKNSDDISPIVERIVSSIKEPFAINQLNIEISCSVGIAIYPLDGDLNKLMVCADAAMYKAKEGGKNQYKYYDADIEQASEQLLALQSELCLAIENNEFILAFQPKIDCRTNLPIGAEALIRWNHPTKGVLPPNAFIEAAERFGLINEINNWVVDECCRTIADAKKAGFKLNFSVNLSTHQFRNPNLVKDILKTLKYYDLDASSLSFEIKETLLINNQAQFKETLEKFREANIHLVLDDFGLHPISLSYLQNLCVNEIKLDQSFIANIAQDKSSKALIDAVIKLAHALELHVVAEGVETELQRDTVVALGCDYMQGFLFSKAIPADELFNLYTHLHNKQFEIGFETSGQLLISDYQMLAVT